VDGKTGLLDSTAADDELGEGDGISPDEVVDPLNDELSISVELPAELLLSDELETIVEAAPGEETLDDMPDGDRLGAELLGTELLGCELLGCELLGAEIMTEDDAVDVAIAVESNELCVERAPEDVVVAGAWKKNRFPTPFPPQLSALLPGQVFVHWNG
jgi:hypothetical protein